MPDTLASTATDRFGSRLVTASQSFPAASLAAIASTRGNVVSPCVYVPASNRTGTKVAFWKGMYILNTW